MPSHNLSLEIKPSVISFEMEHGCYFTKEIEYMGTGLHTFYRPELLSNKPCKFRKSCISYAHDFSMSLSRELSMIRGKDHHILPLSIALETEIFL